MLTDMKMTAAEKKKDNTSICAPRKSEGPDYTYGLCINLNAITLEKLGLDMPKVGTMMKIDAVGVVKSCRMSQREGGEDDSNVEIQLQRLSVVPSKKKTMYDAVDEAIEEASE